MPLHPDFERVKREMIKKHGKERGETIFYKWVNKHGYDDSKPMDKQASSFDDWMEEEMEDMMVVEAKAGSCHISIPAYKMPYVAMPKDEKGGPLGVKAITLEELTNVNGWRVVPEEFSRVAEQYKAGRQLRLNHSKDVQQIIGKSFDSKVLTGKEIPAYMGKEIPGINPEGKYVVTEFEADPQDSQVRTNILRGYVDTGSIGLDANAACDECDKPLLMEGDSMVRTCRHLDAGVKLTDVEVKEYSYVSEPAYPHSFVLPTFAAAISNLPKPKESSINQTQESKPLEMSATQQTKVEADAAKKADAEGEGDDEAIPKRYADAIMEAYKQGLADSKKFRAENEVKKEKEEVKAEVTAAKATDQITRTGVGAEKEPDKNDLIERITQPTKYALKMDAGLRELFRASVKGPTTPPELASKFRGAFD